MIAASRNRVVPGGFCIRKLVLEGNIMAAANEDGTSAVEGNATSAEELIADLLRGHLTPELQAALALPANREMFEYELGRVCTKVVRQGFKAS